MKFRAIMVVTLVLFTGLIGVFNIQAVVAESIPTTEILYNWWSGYSFPIPEIYVIATETNPVEMLQNYTNRSAYYKMLKEHVTTEASVEDFISILVSRGICSTCGYGLEIKSIEKVDYAFVLSANFTDPGWECYVCQALTNPTALIPIGKLPAGEYSITLHIDRYIHHCDGRPREYVGTGTWTAAFKCSEWITVTGPEVEMSIENKTTPVGDEISIFMKTLIGGRFADDSSIFDVYLYDANHSLFSKWFTTHPYAPAGWPVYIPSGFNETLHWNLYRAHTPPPPGIYFLVGILMDEPWFVSGELLVKFNQSISPATENGTVVTGIPSIDELNRQFGVYQFIYLFSDIYKFMLPKDVYIPWIAEIYNEDPHVEFAEPNVILHTYDMPVQYDDREPWDMTPEILLIIDNESITPIGLAEDQDAWIPDITNLIQDPKGSESDPVPPYMNVEISVNVTSFFRVQNVTLYYKTSTDAGETWSEWRNIDMNNTQGNTWIEEIPGFPGHTWVKYKIIAHDVINNEAIMDNAGEYFIYQVVPEFPTWTSILLILILLAVAIAIYKRRLLKTPIH